MSGHHLTGEWKQARKAAKDRDAWRCTDCCKSAVLEVHHVKHVRNGGDDSLDNLTTLCRGCHIEKHRKPRTKAQTAWEYLVEELID